jgi:hypothetical protein
METVSPSGVSMLWQLGPIVLLSIPFLIMNGFIAFRKGKSPILFVILALIPIANIFISMWLISLPDESVLRDVEALKAKVAALENK